MEKFNKANSQVEVVGGNVSPNHTASARTSKRMALVITSYQEEREEFIQANYWRW